MQCYYHANVKVIPIPEAGVQYEVTLICASEDGRETVAVIGEIWDIDAANNLAAFWRTGGHEMVFTLLKANIIKGRCIAEQDDDECGVWIQTQAPAGNWVDSLGCRGPEAVKRAKELVPGLIGNKTPARLVRKQIQVIYVF